MKNNLFLRSSFLNIHESPSLSSKLSSQIIYGEKFRIISKKNDWYKIKTSFDKYIGYIYKPIYIDKFKPTHKIFKLKSKIFIKNKKKNYYLTFSSKISAISENKKFIEYEKNKWLKKKDLNKINHIEKNYLKIIKLFLNTKYVWGGKNYMGIDCSGLLQLFFYYNGMPYPRDTKDQIKYSCDKKNLNKFKKGDILFWKGHVAICINSKKLIHAYGPKKKVLTMDIVNTIDKIKKSTNLKLLKKINIKQCIWKKK